ncbi:MAG TPA: hypothetical protein VGS19_23655 [Streptosporangiaceae bacterium]|nr:hypothetical protein [Streptosporangiaceae bacterium]
MFSLTMNDRAVKHLGILGGFTALVPPGELAPTLRERIAAGVVRYGPVLRWGSSPRLDEGALPPHDLTGWESSDNAFHLEDYIPVAVTLADGVPSISPENRRILLLQGIAFGVELVRLVYDLSPPARVRSIISANDTCATFRFHQIRAGERWNDPDLDNYEIEEVIVIDVEPATL